MADAAARSKQMEGRLQAILNELLALRQATATHLRYLDGEVIDGLRDLRHTREVAANIAEHQSRNLRAAVERTGEILPDGTTHPAQAHIPDDPAPRDPRNG